MDSQKISIVKGDNSQNFSLANFSVLVDLIFVIYAFSKYFVFYLLGMIMLSPLLFILLLGILGYDSSSHIKFHRKYTINVIRYILIAFWLYFYFVGGLDISMDYLMSKGGPARSGSPGLGLIFALFTVLIVFFSVASVLISFIRLIKTKLNQSDANNDVYAVAYPSKARWKAVLYSLLTVICLFLALYLLDYLNCTPFIGQLVSLDLYCI